MDSHWTSLRGAVLQLLGEESGAVSCAHDAQDLYEEVYEKKHSKLQPVEGELVREVRIIKVWLWANILRLGHGRCLWLS